MKTIAFELTIDEANLILEALGQLPFAKVYALIGKVQEQARQQLDGQESIEAKPDPAPPGPSIGE